MIVVIFTHIYYFIYRRIPRRTITYIKSICYSKIKSDRRRHPQIPKIFFLIPALVDFTHSIVQDQKKEDGVNVLAIALGVVGGVIVTAVVVYFLVRYIRTPIQPTQP